MFQPFLKFLTKKRPVKKMKIKKVNSSNDVYYPQKFFDIFYQIIHILLR